MTFRDTLLERLQARDKAANNFHDIIVTSKLCISASLDSSFLNALQTR